MKGKRGPVPDPLDPAPEQIVGEENIVNVDDDYQPEIPAGYHCSDCSFASNHLSEIEEHTNGTGHGGYEAETPPLVTQPELFATPGVIHRMMNVPMPDAFLNERRTQLAFLYQQSLEVREEKKDADSDFNARLKSLDEQMQAIARILKTPHTYEKIACEWKLIENENARGLYRLDTGELLERAALTQEDFVREQEKAATDNQSETVSQ